MVQALIAGVGLWLGLTFLAQLIPLLEKRGSCRPSSWDEPTPSRELQPTSSWDPSCCYLPWAVNPLGSCRCSPCTMSPTAGKKNKLESVPCRWSRKRVGGAGQKYGNSCCHA